MTQKTPRHVLDSLAQDIALVLKSMGGSAHQTMIVDCVAAMKRQRGEPVVPSDLRQKIVEVFEHYRDLFFRPFGEGSQRWALADAAA
ncbi:MAG: hypothetical protein DI552_04500 [Brevundimonas sp.]|jgi:hypothetical protein|uniref:Uncharacterized protein n=2 Tax=Brevundimonas albigilva TaxID=1312364 RepID=A0ABY4SQR2_9CAUL|nr:MULTISPECIES: hypothetical protein [Brevundimonas]MBD3837334.1 hypothetical protein [Brevundimonas sp.]MCV0415650.1 hypothetical protein [Brevundimonas sp.]PZU60699.1 MAG: hypothetical protein DI552_04500 [Brevundimonas sp.]URI15937.1 hypothetical protein M8231_02800 [Brevundimonas albigilva]